MSKQIERLNLAKLKALVKAKVPVREPDGGNLYFQVTKGGAASWLLRYKFGAKTVGGHDAERTMGLGPWPRVSLQQARERARTALDRLRYDGVDPLQERREAKAARKPVHRMTFIEAAEDYHSSKSVGWTDKVSHEFLTTLQRHAFPVIGSMPVADISVPDIMAVLLPMWTPAKVDIAARLRRRIEQVFGYSIATGNRTAANPARWKGQLAAVLPASAKVRKAEHHESLPYADVPSFMAELRTHRTMAALALEFLVLTAARTSEVLGATWSEIDLATKVWVIPASRMKAQKEHRVPLSSAALAILKNAGPGPAGDFVFISSKRTMMNDKTMLQQLERMGRKGDITAHGFRSSFRDWVGDETDFPRELAEAALAHSLGAVERAYRRSDALERRRQMMQSWSDYCAGLKTTSAKVINFR